MSGARVFVGDLAFDTTESTLAQRMGECVPAC